MCKFREQQIYAGIILHTTHFEECTYFHKTEQKKHILRAEAQAERSPNPMELLENTSTDGNPI